MMSKKIALSMLKVKPYKQQPGLCGPASLAMVLNFFGVRASENQLARLSGCTPERGVGAHRLVKALNHFGLKGLVKDFATLADIRRYVRKRRIPVIVDWFSTNDGHYSVVVDITRTHIVLQDPELGRKRTMDLHTFNRVWFDFPGRAIRAKCDLNIRRMIVVLPKILPNVAKRT